MEYVPLLTLAAAVAALLVLLLRRPPSSEDRLERIERGFSEALRSSSTELARSQTDAAGRIRQEVSENLLRGMSDISKRIDEKIVEIRGEMARELAETADRNLKGFDQVAGHLKDLSAATGQMVEDLLGDHGELFDLQYGVEWGERADAAIFVRPDRSQFVCIDAKFPMANAQPLLSGEGDEGSRREAEKLFARDVLAQAQQIAAKYIRPPKTLDFAFMFVPAESVYYLLLKNRALHEQLLRLQVVPASPNNFYAYLQALAFAFRGFKIEQKTREIQVLLERLGQDFERFAENC